MQFRLNCKIIQRKRRHLESKTASFPLIAFIQGDLKLTFNLHIVVDLPGHINFGKPTFCNYCPHSHLLQSYCYVFSMLLGQYFSNKKNVSILLQWQNYHREIMQICRKKIAPRLDAYTIQASSSEFFPKEIWQRGEKNKRFWSKKIRPVSLGLEHKKGLIDRRF